MKLSAHDRVNRLLDPGTFEESDHYSSSVFLIGKGQVQGVRVMLAASRTEPLAEPEDAYASLGVLISVVELATAARCPVFLLLDTPVASGTGSRFPSEPGRLLAGENCVGRLYYLLARLSGIVPRVTIVFGKLGSSMSFPAALSDIVIMTTDSGMCIGRPDVVKQMTGEETTYEALASGTMHCSLSGTGDILADSDADAVDFARKVMTFLPTNCHEAKPLATPVAPNSSGVPLAEIVPAKIETMFDIRRIIAEFVDGNSMLEIQALFAGEAVTCLAKVEGRRIGIVANNSNTKGGILFPRSCRKMSKFIQLCSAFGIPLLFLADVPGFMVGTAVEQEGIIQAGATLFGSIAQAAVPKMTIIIRKAHSAGLYAMAGPGFHSEALYLLPRAYIAIYGRSALERLADSRQLSDEEHASLRSMLEEIDHPQVLVNQGLVDGILELGSVRPTVSNFLQQAPKTGLPDHHPIWR